MKPNLNLNLTIFPLFLSRVSSSSSYHRHHRQPSPPIPYAITYYRTISSLPLSFSLRHCCCDHGLFDFFFFLLQSFKRVTRLHASICWTHKLMDPRRRPKGDVTLWICSVEVRFDSDDFCFVIFRSEFRERFTIENPSNRSVVVVSFVKRYSFTVNLN